MGGHARKWGRPLDSGGLLRADHGAGAALLLPCHAAMTLPLPPHDRPPLTSWADARGPIPATARVVAETVEGSEPEPFDWRRAWTAVRRWRWLVAGITVGGSLLGVVASRIIKPSYRAQATIWIDSRDRQAGAAAPFQPGRLLDPEAWVDLVRSYSVLDAVARQEHLFLRVPPRTAPALVATFQVADTFRPGRYRLVFGRDGTSYRVETADGIELDRQPVGAPLGRRLGFLWSPPAGALPPERPWPFEVVPLRDASARLADDLQLHIDQDGNLLRLELEGTDRDRVAATLNDVADRYVVVVGQLKREKLTELTGRLSDQLDSATKDLVTAESTYQVFRTRTITLPSDRSASASGAGPAGGGGGDAAAPESPAVAEFLALDATRGAIAHDRAAIERALASDTGAGPSIEALNSVPAARQSRELGPALDELATKETELRALRARYSEAHPEVIQLADRVHALRTGTIPALARALAAELGTREGIAQRDAGAAAAALRSIPARSLEDARLRREVMLAEDLHNTLQQRHEEAQLAVESSIPDARVLDRADSPRYPIRDSAPRLIALALLGSLGLALLVAVLLDRFDPRFRYPNQVLRELGLPLLGVLPHVAAAPRGVGARVLPTAGPLIESLRGIRMSLLTLAAEVPSLTLAISSPGSGDGKSFVSAHLALAFAEAGYRTLLVDGDIRCGRQHQRFGVERRPGLCDVLREGVPVGDALHATGHAGLSLLTCGARVRLGPELLAGPAMGALMSELRERFDVIVCDTPPLSAGVDPYVISAVTGRLLLVVRTGISDREMMTAKLAVLRRMPVELLGVVMNDVPPDRSYGYYSYYLEGYEAQDETAGIGAGSAAR